MSIASHSSFPPQTPSAKSFTQQSDADFGEEELNLDGGAEQEDAVHFCLLAEFDIDAGATLAYQYPYPTGTDEHRLAELMLPDGAHLRPEDWTVFYLGQTSSSAIDPMLAHESSLRISKDSEREKRISMAASASSGRPKRGVAGGGLLYVLNCVRMKEDKKMRRGAMVKAMAICTPNPYIGIYKPLLLLALEEYFISPSPEILARLFDSANAISTSGMPRLSRHERILLRSSERKDLFEEKYGNSEPFSGTKETFEENSEAGHSSYEGRSDEAASTRIQGPGQGHRKTLSSASASASASGHGPRTVRKGSASSSQMHMATPPSREGRLTPDFPYANGSGTGEGGRRKGVPRDTHFYETEARFKKVTVPIRIPMTVFDEDVGDYSLIELVQTFSHNTAPFPPRFHPHLHTNGALTHPIILILNALLAHKRVMFLGHGLPANQVARMVLAACALGSGCGQVLRGFAECAFPYANLASLDVLEEFSGFVAGVTNPRFEELPMTWDVLCNLETGKVTVSKELRSGPAGAGAGAGATGAGTMRSGRSSETSLSGSIVKVKVDEESTAGTPQAKMTATSKADCVDNQFMEDILAAMASHYGEANIRLRFTDYLARFVRLAAHQEYTHTGSTKIGYPSQAYRDGQLGTGAVFSDESTKQREMWANGYRIDAWRKTKSYKLFVKDWQADLKKRAIGFDISHQLARLRVAKNMSDAEAETIFAALANGVRTYDQVVELLTHLPAYWGGLIPLANGLFHRWPKVRENALELLTTMQMYPVGRHAIATMNYFHRKTFMQLLERREAQIALQREQERLRLPVPEEYGYGHAPGMGQGNGEYSQGHGYGYGYGSPREGYNSDFASPGTVHGSASATPQGVSRA